MSEQHMFLNYDDDTLTIQIKAYETVTIYVMLASGEEIEDEATTVPLPQNETYVIFNMGIPAGTVYGFRVAYTPEYTNPDAELLTIKTAASKSPWPTPPPPPPSAYGEDFNTRYAAFLYALSATRRQQQAQLAKPAGATEPTAST